MSTDAILDRFLALAEAGKWTDAAATIAVSREPGDVWMRTLARNLASLRTHRPALYAALLSVYGVAEPMFAVGEERRASQAFTDLESYRRTAQAIAVAGIGDGSLLRALAKFLPDLQLGRQQEVNIVEPDVSRLVASLGVTDLAGPRGPIEQKRFAWHVGESWEQSICDELVALPTKMPPQRTIYGGEPRPEVDDGLANVIVRIKQRHSEDSADVERYYAELDDAELVAVHSSNPPRRPRVLLITSQFTAVLQYSTADCADAFRQLRWETHTCTETHPWHVMSRHAIRAAIAEFKPDLVFQIDHLRHELADAVPAKLPFVCWIQDHLVNLTSAEAGAAIGERDFVLTGGVYRYVTRYGYPRQQCIDMPKASRAPVLPTTWTSSREDLLYVSHWSQTPETIIVETCARMGEIAGAGAQRMMHACCREMAAVYAAGGAMRIDLEVRQLVHKVFARVGEVMEPDGDRFFVDVLFQRLNNAFYRQQALEWAGRIADEQGLKFGIYGNGWEKHPTLGRFARGVVKYGPDLETLTRESKILLQLEPYACFTHQRMLDAILAGGFALIREHPLNTLPIRIRTFLDAYVPPEINTVVDAKRCLDTRRLAEFERLLEDSQILADLGDVVDIIRGWQRAGIIGNGTEALPHLDAIGFDSFDGLRDRVTRYLYDANERNRVSSDQRASILERLTYVSAMGRATRAIHQRLSDSIGKTSTDRVAEAA